MEQVTVTGDVLAAVQHWGDSLELLDPTGRVLGIYHPVHAAAPSHRLTPSAETEAEVRRRADEAGEMSLEEAWQRIKLRAKS